MQSESGPSLQKKKPTQQDVARLAGVSQATVSYVLNNRTTVSVPSETRARVLAAMQELGYVPNVTARSLRTSKSYTIASVIPDITNPFYPALQRGIQDVVQSEGYHLIIYNTDGLASREAKCLRSIQEVHVDGIIGVFFHTDAPSLFSLLDRGIAIVRLEASPKSVGIRPLDNVYVDNIKAAKTGVRYLLENGYRRIGMLAGDVGPGQLRLTGYRQAHAELGLRVDETLVCMADFTKEGGEASANRLLARDDMPDAIFASNDMMAVGALTAIRAAGYRIPEDVAVMGFDNISTVEFVSPPLTTISQSQSLMGRRAAEMLFERLNGEVEATGRCEELPFELIVREST